MRIDQIAYYCATLADEARVKKHFGLYGKEWIEDTVTAVSSVLRDDPAVNVAHLQFNYDLGIELEIIRYIEGYHWHAALGLTPGPNISHVGIHLAGGEDFPFIADLLVQETWTTTHTAEYLTTGAGAGRKYHYRIYRIGTGNYVKYIKRINP